ncbi:MAG: hypothetical protein OEY38_19610 [Gammaproteobacteria bacterium]|nr:hypothetical protein [Gammaproteobacteria bacterium]
MCIIKFLTNLTTKNKIIWLIIGFSIMMLGGLTTESAFSKVNYPGSDFGGVPLTFDLQLKQENLSILERQGTLDLFVTVQYLDVGIIIGTLLFFTFLTLLIIKPFEQKSVFHKTGIVAIASFLIAPTMDALENISMLILIAFRDQKDLLWLSFLNSGFTLGKMTFFYIGWILAGIIIFSLLYRLCRRIIDKQNEPPPF